MGRKMRVCTQYAVCMYVCIYGKQALYYKPTFHLVCITCVSMTCLNQGSPAAAEGGDRDLVCVASCFSLFL